MVLKALSCMEVAICTRLTAIPAMKPMASSGAASQKAVIRVCADDLNDGFGRHW